MKEVEKAAPGTPKTLQTSCPVNGLPCTSSSARDALPRLARKGLEI